MYNNNKYDEDFKMFINDNLFNYINFYKSPDNNNPEISDIHNKNTKDDNKRKTRSETTNPNKKFKSDTEIINLFINNNNNNEDNNSDGSDNDDELKCNNPLCDHKEFTKAELANVKKETRRPIKINNVDDLIELGKTFHCKKNKSYYDINLRILCNLVKPLTELKNLVGMKSVKENIVNQIVFFLQGFNQKEKCGHCIDCIYGLTCTRNINNDMLHTVITGPPGVGKTELGKILGHIYKQMGILSKGHFNIATRSDLVGKYLGHSHSKTQAFLDKCKGGVMFIDEAYSLGNPEGRDSFSKEVIDCINQNLTERRDFLCIIAGYADSLEKCFFAYNEGLRRRFTFRYDIPGYSYEELMEIFLLKVRNDCWQIEIDNNSQNKLKELFKNNTKNFPNYGGDMETFFLNCKIIHGRRVFGLDPSARKILTFEDIEKGLEFLVVHRKIQDKEEMSDSIKRMYL